MKDKVGELAEKLTEHVPAQLKETQVQWTEWVLRAELKPLLDAAQVVRNKLASSPRLYSELLSGDDIDRLAAELKGWRKETP